MSKINRQRGAFVWKAVGGLAIVAGSFFATLKAMDYWEIGSISGKAEPPSPVTIEEATYGANCGSSVKVGNVTQQAAKGCDGRAACNISISVQEWGDPAPGCGKDFSLRFRCGEQQPSRKLHVNGEANGSRLLVDCEKHSLFW